MPLQYTLNDKELTVWEDSRDIGSELTQSVQEMLLEQGRPVEISPVVAIRMQTGATQSQFAKLLGISVRTLQEWEQGRRKPSGAAQTLFRIVKSRPEILQELIAA